MRRVVIQVCLLLLACEALAQQSTEATGEHSMDLGFLIGAHEAITHYRDICSETFPQQQKINADAYRVWRSKNLKALQEVERHWTTQLKEASGGNPGMVLQAERQRKTSMLQSRQALHEQLKGAGESNFLAVCNGFSGFLAGDRASFERFYSEHFQTLRGAKPPR